MEDGSFIWKSGQVVSMIEAIRTQLLLSIIIYYYHYHYYYYSY